MAAKSKGPAANEAITRENPKPCQIKSSTGVIRSQQPVVAVGEFRNVLLDYLLSLPAPACLNDHFDFRHDGPNSVLVCGFERLDGSEAIELEVTLHNWHPRSSIPVLDLCSDITRLESDTTDALEVARSGRRQGRTILTTRDPRQLLEDLRDLQRAASQLFDKVESQANWLPIPDDVVVSVRWFAVKPSGGAR